MTNDTNAQPETFSMYLPFWVLVHENPGGQRPPVCTPDTTHSPVEMGSDSGKHGRSIAIFTAEDIALREVERYVRMPGAFNRVYPVRLEEANDLIGLVKCAELRGVRSFAFDPQFFPELPDFSDRFRSLDMMREALGTFELVPVGHHD